ncbi:MAG TPA: cation:proton antiporter [Gemmatimonadaceae bacterium]|nr:cation:proton antiporter [Gemmatimonadaceae bacterium]
MQLSGSIVLLLLASTAVALLAKRLRAPYIVALVIAGLVLGVTGLIPAPRLTKNLLFALFLPGLLFDSSVRMEAEEFWRNRIPIFSLALPAVVAATALIAGALVLLLRIVTPTSAIAWGPAIVFATLIAATDPIAVVAIVRSLGAPSRLGVLIEGESLLNDGTAAVSFTAAVAYVLGTSTGPLRIAGAFAYEIAGAVVIGLVIGWLTSRIMTWLEDAMLMISVSVAAAYGAFILAELVHASGVIATVTAGLLAGRHSVLEQIDDEYRVGLRAFWEYVAFALNSIVFLLIGFGANVAALASAWRPIVVAYVVVTVARIAVVYAVSAVMPKRQRLPTRWTAIVSWSGLRGSMSMVLAISLPAATPQRGLVVSMTLGVVLLSILIQGLTVGPLLRRLHIGGDAPALVHDNAG